MNAKFLIVGLLCMSTLMLREISRLPNGNLHLHVLDVGQGDSILLVTPSGKQILIDGGPSLSTLEHLDDLLPFFDRTIELVVLSHADSDHITALPSVLDRYQIDLMLMTDDLHTTGKYTELVASISEKRIPVMIPDPTVDIDLGDGVVLDVIWPVRGWKGSKNDRSVVLRALYRDHEILLAGDIEQKAEQAILALGSDVRSDVLKVAHHGSRTSTSTGFLLAASPQIAIVSAGRYNRFGHPHKEVMDRLAHFGTYIKTTANNGVVSMTFQ